MKRKLFVFAGVLLVSLLVVGVAYAFSTGNIDGVWGLIDVGGGSPGELVDVIGVIGNTSIGPGGEDEMYTRKIAVCVGDPDGDISFTDWTRLTNEVFTGLGSPTVGACTTATSLFISEYVYDQTSGDDELGIEIYNGTGAAVDLTGYVVRLYTAPTTYTVIDLNNVSLSIGDVYVIVNSAAAGLTNNEDQTIANNDTYRTVVLVKDYAPDPDGIVDGATCNTWATVLNGSPTAYSTTDPSIQTGSTTDENQVRYGDPVNYDCPGGTDWQQEFLHQSGMGFNGSDSIPDVAYQTPFVLGRYCHYNNPINAANSFEYVPLDVTVADLTCDAAAISGPVPSTMTFSYQFTLDETPNSTPCTYPSDVGNPCSDAVAVAQAPADQTFACTYNGNVTVDYTVVILGFMNPVNDVCPAWNAANAVGTFISQEGTNTCACLYAMISDYVPTAVDLISFTAEGTQDGILLKWETASEIDNLGFNIYRADTLYGDRTQINAELIPSEAAGSPSGASYQYLDDTALAGHQYYYWLEDIDISGVSLPTSMNGPVDAISGVPAWKMFLPMIKTFGAANVSSPAK